MGDEEPRQYVSVSPPAKQSVLNEIIQYSRYDVASHEYVLPDGTRIDEATLMHMGPGPLGALLNKLSLKRPMPNRQPMTMPVVGTDVPNGTIVTWKSKKIFTYAAVKAGDNWYITGKGEFYGKNVFAHGEFCNVVLATAEVSDIQIVTDLLPLDLD